MNIIVTGASRGIGYKLVEWFARQGDHNILAVSRNEEKLSKLKNEVSQASIRTLSFDIAGGDYEKDFLPVLREFQSGVDILVNNAGRLVNKPVKDTSDEEFDAQFAVNIRAPFRLAKALEPWFNTGAHIVNISSMGGYQGSVKFPGLSVYSASKGALTIFTEALAEEWKDKNVFVNALALEAVQTEMLGEAFPGMKVETSPEKMADFIGNFALNKHKFFNGKVLPVTNSTP